MLLLKFMFAFVADAVVTIELWADDDDGGGGGGVAWRANLSSILAAVTVTLFSGDACMYVSERTSVAIQQIINILKQTIRFSSCRFCNN